MSSTVFCISSRYFFALSELADATLSVLLCSSKILSLHFRYLAFAAFLASSSGSGDGVRLRLGEMSFAVLRSGSYDKTPDSYMSLR